MDRGKLAFWTLHFVYLVMCLLGEQAAGCLRVFLVIHDILITCAEESRDPKPLLGSESTDVYRYPGRQSIN